MQEKPIEEEIDLIVNFYTKNPNGEGLKAAIKTLLKKVKK